MQPPTNITYETATKATQSSDYKEAELALQAPKNNITDIDHRNFRRMTIEEKKRPEKLTFEDKLGFFMNLNSGETELEPEPIVTKIGKQITEGLKTRTQLGENREGRKLFTSIGKKKTENRKLSILPKYSAKKTANLSPKPKTPLKFKRLQGNYSSLEKIKKIGEINAQIVEKTKFFENYFRSRENETDGHTTPNIRSTHSKKFTNQLCEGSERLNSPICTQPTRPGVTVLNCPDGSQSGEENQKQDQILSRPSDQCQLDNCLRRVL